MKLLIDGQGYTWPAPTSANASVAAALPEPVLRHPALGSFLSSLFHLNLFEIRIEFDADLAALWCFQQHRAGVSFAPRLLRDIRKVQRAVQDFHRDEPELARRYVKFLVWASDVEGVFNLGGDLAYFVKLLRQRDHHRLKAYAYSCIDVCYANYSGLNAPVIVGALVAGDALGGGMESALSCDFILAEEQAKFGLPEMVYSLFPGMGAYSFLARRLGQARAEHLILRGDLHTADQLAETGLVERVTANGQGRSEMNRHLEKTLRRFEASHAVYRARRRAFPLTFQELADIAEDWVWVAMRLSDKDLRRMERLVAAQKRLRGPTLTETEVKSA